MSEQNMIINGKEIKKDEPKIKKHSKVKSYLIGTRKRKQITFYTLLAVLVIVGVAALYIFIYLPSRPVITINGQKIFKKDIIKEQAKYKAFYELTEDKQALSNPYNTAKKRLIEETIITTEAQKRGVTVTQKEIDDQYNRQRASHGSEKEYLDMVSSAYGWDKDQIINIIRQNLLKQKLMQLVLNAYSGDIAYVRYDMYGKNQQLIDIAKAKADDLRKQIIAGKTVKDVVAVYENDPYWQHPFMGSLKFTDINANNAKLTFKEPEDWQNISKLNKVGDVTDVFKSSSGYFAVAVLNSKSSGGYDSWDAFIAHFTNK